MLKQIIEKLIKESASAIVAPDGQKLEISDVLLEIPRDSQHGDYSSTVAFAIGKKIQKLPAATAALLAQNMSAHLPPEIAKAEASPNGFINFFADEKFIQNELEKIYRRKEEYGPLRDGQNRKIIVDYSSPNIAKPMHIGHLRSTVIGEALANLYEFLGYKVIRWNYLGDWGTQFGKLIAAYKLWGDKKEVEKDPIASLLELYVRFHQEMKKDPGLEKRGQEEFKKLEQGDRENRKLWQWFRDSSLKDFQKIYALLNIKFDLFLGESSLEKDLSGIISLLRDKKILRQSEGALIVSLEKYHLPPALIQKSDEASLYLTRDLALLQYRLQKYHPAKILYVVGNEQDIHFQQLFIIAKMIFPASSCELQHIKFGLVLSEQKKKLSTREGKIISLEQIINEIVETALKIVQEKNPQWPTAKKQKVARAIAVGALKFNDLKSFRNADIVFDQEKMLALTGDTSVYLQYTYARLHKILVKAGKIGRFDCQTLNHKLEIALIKKMMEFTDAIRASAEKYAPNQLASYLLSFADLINSYYETVPVLKETNQNRQNAQLILLQTMAGILEQGCQILGIELLPEI